MDIRMIKLLSWALLGTVVGAEEVERMTVSKMRMSDLATSGTGYAYSRQQGYPASYVRYTNHGAQVYLDAPKPVHYLVPPVARAANFLYPNLGPAPLVYAQSVPARHFAPAEPSSYQKFELRGEDSSEEDEHSAENASHENARVNDAGESYDAAKYSAHGAKGEKGYRSESEFDEGEKGEHFEDNHKGHYSEEGGHEKARGETAAHYSQHDEEKKGAKGENFGKTKYHKKGHKTSGFHNVYRKDEYKKDTDFYDEEHESGNFEKYGAENERHREAEGAFKKGLKHEAAHERGEHGKEGSVDRGRHHKHRQGHSHKKAEDSYHKGGAQFAKAGGKEYKKEFARGEHGYFK